MTNFTITRNRGKKKCWGGHGVVVASPSLPCSHEIPSETDEEHVMLAETLIERQLTDVID